MIPSSYLIYALSIQLMVNPQPSELIAVEAQSANWGTLGEEVEVGGGTGKAVGAGRGADEGYLQAHSLSFTHSPPAFWHILL